MDDDEIVRFALEEILTKMANYSITQVKNGLEAVEAVAERMSLQCCQWFKCIIMDVNMP